MWAKVLKYIHPYDDYSVRAVKDNDIRNNIHTFFTPWFFRAVMMYVYFHFKYPKCTIVFTHRNYKRR